MRFFLWPAAALFVVSPCMHGATFFANKYVDMDMHTGTWVLHVLCLFVIPSGILGLRMSAIACEFLYVAFAVGPVEAITGSVHFLPTEQGPTMLSNGLEVNGSVYAAVSLIVGLPLWALVSTGLIHLGDTLGRFVENIRRKK
jgi:hypothetical protein